MLPLPPPPPPPLLSPPLQVYPWSITGSDLHPLHTHIVHMQFGEELTAANQWTEVRTGSAFATM
jgi:hypothetical protein